MLWMLLSCVINYQEDGNLKRISVEQTQAVRHYNYNKAVSSSLKILSFNFMFEDNGHGSGNYFKIGKHRFILTAAHLVSSDTFQYVQDGLELVKLELVHLDVDRDIAIMVPIQELKNTAAVNYVINEKEDILGLSIIHAGYPSTLEKSVFNGMVSRCSLDFFVMQSLALPGSSGSVVFDNGGRIVGVVSAVKLEMHPHSPFPELQETLVFVSRTNQYKREKVKGILEKWKG